MWMPWTAPQAAPPRSSHREISDASRLPPDTSCALRRCSQARLTDATARRSVLFVEPHVFHAPAVIDAVDHQRQSLHLRLQAGGADLVIDNRPGAVLLQFPIDLPHQLLALRLVGLHRLLVRHLVAFAVAIAAVVAG